MSSKKNRANTGPSAEISTEIAEITTALDKVERRITKFFTRNSAQYGRDPIIAAVLAHFYLHRELSQEQLRVLTSYSAGAISQALSELVSHKIVTKTRPEIPGPFRYSIQNLVQILAQSSVGITEIYLSHEPLFHEIKQGLETIPKELHSERLYTSLSEYIAIIFQILPIYKQMTDLVNQEIDKLSKTK